MPYATSNNALPPLSLNRTRAADDTDGATQQTVRKMCDLIAESVKDPVVQACAAYAKKRFARGSSDPAAILWGVFWYIKHCVKFRSDEGTMLQVGETGSQDLLIAPAVLVRMDKPSEDCDGFTMLGAAMLTILGVPVYITTVATDLDDPRRWSHVFLCANLNGRIVPLDTSHGKAPGWMVPRDRINRFQTWTLDGRPADVKIPNFQGLHGYVGLGSVMRGRRRGMGAWVCPDPSNADTCYDDGTSTPPVTTPPVDCGSFALTPAQAAACGQLSGTPGSGGYVVPLNTPVTPQQAGLTTAQIAQLIAATGNSTVSLIRTASGGPYTVAGTNLVYNPATGQLTSVANPYGLNVSGLPASIMNNLPLIGGALLLILVLPALTGRK